jgi:hypothetical protein
VASATSTAGPAERVAAEAPGLGIGAGVEQPATLGLTGLDVFRIAIGVELDLVGTAGDGDLVVEVVDVE